MDYTITPKAVRQVIQGSNLDEKLSEALCKDLTLHAGDLFLINDTFDITRDHSNEFLVLLMLLCDSVNKGSLCLVLSHEALESKLQQSAAHLDVGSLLEKVQNLPINLCTPSAEDGTLLVKQQDKLYFHKYAVNEVRLQTQIASLLAHQHETSLDTLDVQQVVNDILCTTKYALAPMQLLALINTLYNPFSIISGGPGTGKTTIMVAVLRGLMRLGVIHCVSQIVLAAPTGRAAKRMTEALHNGIKHDLLSDNENDNHLLTLESQTLHRLLGVNPMQEESTYHAGNLLRAKVIVVDEVSMVDIVMMNRFIQAVPTDCKIILLGDQYQLPSVDAGAVLSDLMPPLGSLAQFSKDFAQRVLNALPAPQTDNKLTAQSIQKIKATLAVQQNESMMLNQVTILDEPQRCQKDIQTLSMSIKNGEVEVASHFLQSRRIDPEKAALPAHDINGMFHLSPQTGFSIESWKKLYLRWFDAYFLSDDSYSYIKQLRALKLNFDELHTNILPLKSLFNKVFENRILCAVRSGPYGADTLNFHICKHMRSKLSGGKDILFHGSIIMIAENDNNRDLFNGDTGILLQDKQTQQLRAVFQYKDGFRSFALHGLPKFQSAFAMTVHKSQGSEFDRILLALPDDPQHRLLTREILYTGLTRAKNQACLLASQECLEAGIRSKVERDSGLNFWV